MMIPILAAEAFCVVTTAIQVASSLIAAIRCKSPAAHLRATGAINRSKALE